MFFRCLHLINILTILLSTVGVASYRHYCQDQLKSVSFFADLIVPCCKKKTKTTKKLKACCSSKKACSNTSTKQYANHIEFALASQLKKEQTKSTIQKRNCCSDKSHFAQGDIESVVDQWQTIGNSFVALLPFQLSNHQSFFYTYFGENSIKVLYNWLCFYPPPNAPLYIWHQAFLC